MNGSLEARLGPKPDAVLLDLDNTLYPYTPSHTAGMAAVRDRCVERLGLETGAFDAAFATARDAIKARLRGTAASHHRLLYFQRLVEAVTGKSDPQLSLELEKTYWRRFLATARLFPGARDFLEELRYARIPTALVTDLTADIQMRKLVYFELVNAFDVVVTSEEAGADKPSPAGFALALDKLGLRAEGARIWMIGDSHLEDLQGAKAAVGAFTIQKIHHGIHPSPDADLQIPDFESLAEAVRRCYPRTA